MDTTKLEDAGPQEPVRAQVSHHHHQPPPVKNLPDLVRQLFEKKNKELLNKLHDYHIRKKSSQREKLAKLKEFYQAELKNVKRKQWCAVCLRESNYHCCWNTSYCSENCQLVHWGSGGHSKACTRSQERGEN